MVTINEGKTYFADDYTMNRLKQLEEENKKLKAETEEKYIKPQDAIEIRTLKDIIDKIPNNKVDAFLEDLRTWLNVTHGLRVTAKTIASLGMPADSIKFEDDVLNWVDDGVQGMSELVFTIKQDAEGKLKKKE